MKREYFFSALVGMILFFSAVHAAPPAQQAYIKASNTDSNDFFGYSVAVFGDTMVVGALGESSSATGINGNQSNDSVSNSGAAYVFVRNGTNWTQQAYLKASNTGTNDFFGCSVAISGDTIVIGAYGEQSNATGANGNQSNNSAAQSGAAYVFVRNGTNWAQQAYLKASNTGTNDQFGYSVALSGDTIVVGAHQEDSTAVGVNGTGSDLTTNFNSGAAYVFVRAGTNWIQQAYLKASNTGANDFFGTAVAVSGDTVVVGSPGEASNATGVNGNQNDNSAYPAGAAYVFVRTGTNWAQQAYLKASNTGAGDRFGNSLALSGETVVVGAEFERSNALGVNGNQNDNSAQDAGAAYVFARQGGNWVQQAYLKASNTGISNHFAYSVAVSDDTLVIGAHGEESIATGVNGDQRNDSGSPSGAAYVFVRTGTNWFQPAYLKASNTGASDRFGSVAVSSNTVVVGASREDSNAIGVNGSQSDNSALDSGAIYVFTGLEVTGPPIMIASDTNGGYFIRGNGLAGFTYQLERAMSVTGPWTSNATITALSSGSIEFHETNAPAGKAFYRVSQ